MAKSSGGRQETPGVSPPFPRSFSSEPSPKSTSIRLRDIYDPKPQTAKTPVRIRPPGPRPPSVQPPVSSGPAEKVMARASCDPPTKTIIRKRSQSLPLSIDRKKGPRNPQVRFVDSLGLELEDVKFYKVWENPLIPTHVLSRLLMSAELSSGRSLELPLHYFKPCFPDNMAAQSGFLERLCSQKVSLEHVLSSDHGITGAARVLNLAFEKDVTVHYSFTNWRTHADTKASWVSSVCPGEAGGPEADVFRFHLPVPPFILQPGAVLEFAICYRVKDSVFWDNNNGQNYKLSCHSYKLIVPKECEDSMLHFT